MEDFITMAILAVLCFALYHFVNWCGTKIPYDPVYDSRGYRREPLMREDLDELDRRCIGKSSKEQRWIVRHYRSKA
ncbi:MAG: hypothetical protein IJ418_05920 [Clostridia bacterium]|nr:hypothetical protein [Clostridia bacterium]